MNTKPYLLTLFAGLIMACQNTTTINYPTTAKKPVTDRYFEVDVEDPYRWLEDDNSEETADWVAAQNDVTFDYLDKIPYREQLKNRIEQLWNYEKVTAPYQEGDYTYYRKNSGVQNQYVVYRQKEGGVEEVFLDPNTFSEDGTTSLAGLQFSKDGSLAAYTISEGGSDWRKVIVIDTDTKEIIEDTLVDVKFSGTQWKGNEGFFYSSYDKPDGSVLSAKTDQHKLYFHQLGTPQSADVLIFGGTAAQKHRYVGAQVTEDGRYLMISASNSTSGNALYLKDLSRKNAPLVTMVDHEEYDTYMLHSQGDRFYLVTNKEAPNQKVVTADLLEKQNHLLNSHLRLRLGL